MRVFEIDLQSIEPFTLESGEVLDRLELRATVYGELNAAKSNAVFIFHALTGSSRIADWWTELLGSGRSFDTSQKAFVCVNCLGSCYGSTSGATLRRRSRKGKLPVVTTRDIVRASARLFEHLGIQKFETVVGGSVGGMLALQFAAEFPNQTGEVIAIGAAPLGAMGLALNHIQRQALELGDIKIARQIAMLSYKSAAGFNDRFGRRPNRNGENPERGHADRFDIGGYLDHQGDIFERRFELDSYRVMTRAMDLFDLSDKEIAAITARVTLVGISSDWLFPPDDVRNFASRLVANGANAEYAEIQSGDGHDAFLSDVVAMNDVLAEIMARRRPSPVHLRAA